MTLPGYEKLVLDHDTAVAVRAVRLYAETHPRPSQITQEQAAEMAEVSRATISRLIKAGVLKLNKFGRIPIAEFDRALTTNLSS